MDGQDARLGEADVRALVRLLGEVAGMREPVAARKRWLMEGLCELVEADAWVWVLTSFGADPGREYAAVHLLHGGLTEADLGRYFQASYDEANPLPEYAALTSLVASGVAFTRRRPQLVPDELWYGHKPLERMRKALDLNESVYAFYPVDGDLWSAVGFHRRWGRPAFTPRQARLVHIVFSESGYLLDSTCPHP